jgi:tripartite-type tricarboxylate transporter receptor subunit TctC
LHPRPWNFVAAIVAAISLSWPLPPAHSAEFPERPLQIVVPYALGGPSDVGTRLMAEALSRHIGHPVGCSRQPPHCRRLAASLERINLRSVRS